MSLLVKTVSSMEKIRSKAGAFGEEQKSVRLFLGQHFAYQLAVLSKSKCLIKVSVSSEIEKYIKLYSVKDVVMDYPFDPEQSDNDFIAFVPGMMPDLLTDLDSQNGYIRISDEMSVIWVNAEIPCDAKPGKYFVTISFETENEHTDSTMEVEIADVTIPKQKLIFTQWHHTDCIANAHSVSVYSEKHWELIDKYIALAAQLGINMIYTPVLTPALDTAVGVKRRCTQLVGIKKNGNEYLFDFSMLKRWLSICRKNKIEYIEISHLFSQWGLEYSPNIEVTENGERSCMFGWHVKATDPSYKDFLEQFLPQLIDFLRGEGVLDKCYFHISDEPSLNHIDAYRYAHDIVAPLLKGCKVIEALSDIDFCETGLVKIPVSATNHIEPFLKKHVEHQWAYYCCGQSDKVGNRFLSMPSYRNRILGLQLYKYDIEGFLQWGYNFYNSGLSLYEINPYVTTSADKIFPSGDSFSVYPGKDGPLPSMRAFVFKDALQDISICRMLEKQIGKEAVIKLMEEEAGMEITFSQYPKDNEFVPKLIEKMKNIICS